MNDRVVILTGGVGGAKLVLGAIHVMPPEHVTAIVNTGDDFRHFSLHVSPDIDTLLYTLAGKANAAQGWGREAESWQFMAALRSLGGEDWFQLGDGDLALHVLRTARLAEGQTLSRITADFARQRGIAATILPISDHPVATCLDTDEGPLAFQPYFVGRRCAPVVRSIHFAGAEESRPAPGVIEALGDPDNRAILIAPSNPILSVDPILAVPGLRDAPAPVIAVSPIVGGQAVKGPTAKLMAEFGLKTDPPAIAAHYLGVIDGLLIDVRDLPGSLDIAFDAIDTLMHSLDDRRRVANAALEFADRLRS